MGPVPGRRLDATAVSRVVPVRACLSDVPQHIWDDTKHVYIGRSRLPSYGYMAFIGHRSCHTVERPDSVIAQVDPPRVNNSELFLAYY